MIESFFIAESEFEELSDSEKGKSSSSEEETKEDFAAVAANKQVSDEKESEEESEEESDEESSSEEESESESDTPPEPVKVKVVICSDHIIT